MELIREISLQDLLRRYKASGDELAREQLIVAYSPLAKYVAGRMSSGLPAHVELSELIYHGLGGLVSAIEGFDLGREINFETYAIIRIRRAIIDEMRTLELLPRSVPARAREIERVNMKLEAKLQRAPTDDEMAAALELSPEDFGDALLEISAPTIVAFDELWTISDSTNQVSLVDTLPDDVPAAETAIDQSQLRERIVDAIGALPELEKRVVALHCYLTLQGIGEVLGVSESRVSQLHTKAILRLRSKLREVAEDSAATTTHPPNLPPDPSTPCDPTPNAESVTATRDDGRNLNKPAGEARISGRSTVDAHEIHTATVRPSLDDPNSQLKGEPSQPDSEQNVSPFRQHVAAQVNELDDEALVTAAFEQFWATLGNDDTVDPVLRDGVLADLHDAEQQLERDAERAGEGRRRMRSFLLNARLVQSELRR